MKKPLLLCLSIVWVSGCSPTPYKITKAPLEKSDLKIQTIDTLQCQQSAQLNWPGIFQVLFCGVGAKVCQNLSDQRFESCMTSKGYKIGAAD